MGRLLGTVPRTSRAALLVLLAAGTATAVFVWWPPLHFAYRGRELHVALETAAALAASLGAFLVLGRFERRRRLDDLLLVLALALFALTNFAFLAVPAMFGAGPPGVFSVWAALTGRVLGATAFVAAALGPSRRLRRPRAAVLVLALAVLLTALAGVVVALLEPRLPTGVEARLRPETSDHPRLIGHPAVLSVQLVTMTLFALAAAGFLRRARREDDPFLGRLAAASILAAFARLHYFLYPSLYTEWVYSGDAFRLLFYAAIVAIAAEEIRNHWRSAARAAALEERSRLARDLHDGLAQELASVSRNLQWLDRDDEPVRRALAATRRALIESRRAIAALTAPVDRPVDAALGDALRDVAARERTEVTLAVDAGVVVTAAEREALVRIACEAVTNAARHGRAPLVHVRLERDGHGLRLLVVDGGTGFDPASAPGREGFGLVSMRERARELGGRFRLSSAPGRGTEVEVDL